MATVCTSRTILIDKHSRIAEYAQPSTVFAPLFWMPGVGHRANAPLRVRHHNGGATVTASQTSYTQGGTVGVGRILFGYRAMVVNISKSYSAAINAGLQRGVTGKLCAPFAVPQGNRHVRASHTLQQDRRRFRYLHQAEAPFKLLGQVAYKAWPMLRSGDQILEIGEHLATKIGRAHV